MDSLFALAVAAGLGIITGKIAEKKGHSFWTWWFYGWMLFIVAIIHVQFIEDYNAPKRVATVEPRQTLGVADEIRKYKNLLDDGVISEEEFNKKKKELMG